MSYEGMTYEVILQRMLDRVTTKYPNIDTREGSILFNALAPAAMELAITYAELDNLKNESFVNTATREYVLVACESLGMDISVFEASCGVHKGKFNVEVEIGSRWNCDLYNYRVEEYIELNGGYHTYKLVCETSGTAPNAVTGDLAPITYIPSGLSYAKVTGCLVEGENEATDEEVKTAYYDYVKNSPEDGNIAQYQKWCSEYDGVGACKIFPLWNGANTVKVSILNASNGVASQELIDEFQEYLDPMGSGMGDGVAPIGAFVTVSTATEVPVVVEATITMKENYSDTTPIETAIQNYFSQIAYQKNQVSYLNVGAVILGVEGVETVTSMTLNGGTSDIVLEDEKIPVLNIEGSVWSVV